MRRMASRAGLTNKATTKRKQTENHKTSTFGQANPVTFHHTRLGNERASAENGILPERRQHLQRFEQQAAHSSILRNNQHGLGLARHDNAHTPPQQP